MDSKTELTEKNRSCAIDWKFLPLKIHYFLLCGGHVGVIPYLPVFAKSRLGLSATIVGILSTCMQFSTALSKPIFGLLGDYTDKINALIVGLICSEVLLILFTLGIPAVNNINSYAESDLGETQQNLDHNCENIFSTFSKEQLSSNTTKNQPFNQTAGTRSETETKQSQKKSSGNSYIHINLPNIYGHNTLYSEKKFKKCNLHCSSFIPNATCLWRNESCININATRDLQCKLQSQIEDFKPNLFIYFNITYTLQENDLETTTFNKIFPQKVTFDYDKGESSTPFCNIRASECILDCNDKIKFCFQTRNLQDVYYLSFWVFAVCSVLSVMCQGAIYSLSDVVCYENVKYTSSSYGQQRFFGAIGWGLMAPVSGFLNGLAPEDSEHSYTPGFYLMVVLSAFLLLNTYNINMKKPKCNLTQSDSNIKTIFLSTEFLCVEMCILSSGALTAYTSNYITWYLESLGSDQLLMGMALGVECIFGEAIFMYFSQRIISKFGHWNVFTITFIAFSVRFVGYYLLQNVWFVLPIEILHGITYGLFYTTITSYAKEISSPNSEATIQGVFGGTFQGLGTGLGTLVAGVLFDKYGGRMAFLMAAIFSCFAALITSITSIFLTRKKPEEYEYRIAETFP